MALDVSLPPYNVVGDISVNDNWQRIMDAATDLAANNAAVHPDNGGTWGGVIQLPRGRIKITDTLTLPDGVALQGDNYYSTTLVFPDTFPTDKNGIEIGDPTVHQSTFGGFVRNMNIWFDPNATANLAVAAVYSNKIQDSGHCLQNLRIYGNQRRSIRFETGWGGASLVSIKDVVWNTTTTGLVGAYFNYGPGTMLEIDGAEPSAARMNNDPGHPDYNKVKPGTMGLAIAGGQTKIRRLHCEMVETGLLINMTDSESTCDVQRVTGGPMTTNLIVVSNSAPQIGNVKVGFVRRNGITGHTLQVGHNSSLNNNGNIKDPFWV